MRGTTNTIKPQVEHSLFSRQRTSSVERELASTPYAFTPKPIRQADDPIQRAKESLLNPFEDDINVRLAKQRLFGQQQRELDRPPSPTIFPSTEDFGRRLNKAAFEGSIFDNESEVSSVRTVEDAQARYRRSRALAEDHVDRFYRSLAGGEDARDRSTSVESDAPVVSVAPVRPVVLRPPALDAAVPGGDAFTVLPQPDVNTNAVTTSEDQDSTSSTPSSFKLPTTVRSHRNTAFAIVGESVVSGPPAVQAIVPEEPSIVPVDALPPAAPPIQNPGRVSPFRGKGFKGELSSRHTTPKTSTNTSPQRSRANSLSKPSVSFERPVTPPRNYIKENIQEVKELSQFNKERNEEIAARKKFQEELEILKELGLLSDAKIPTYSKPGIARVDSRSRMISPSILHFENIPVTSRPHIEYSFDKFDTFGNSWKPTGKTSMRVVSRSQPQSKSGSPQHHSKIPRRQASVSPPRQSRITFEQLPPSMMSNRISADGRFISNSTSSINDKRVFSVIMDDKDNPMHPDLSYESRSRSSQNLEAPTSILKSKPPRSPSRLGPPPTSKGINSKRLSPIVATPDKSPARPGMDRGKSKTPTPKVTSPSRIPKRPSKSLAASPNSSRAPSRTPSRGALYDSSSKKSTSVSRNVNNKSSSQTGKTTSGRNSRSDMHSDSKISDGKPGLKRINSRTSITSKMSTTNKPELTRMNSRTSLSKTLTRTNSIKNMNDKSGTLRRKSSMKNLKEKSIEENSSKDKSPKSRSPVAEKKGTKDKKETEEVNTQDNETQYDKISQLDLNMSKLIPLTKTSVVSMTTAAITAQPLDIAAKVTSQLPAALEKAREKGMFDRNSSSDSLATKMVGESTKTDDAAGKGDKEKNLQKTASKTSLGSVKEEKEPLKKGGMKLIPLDGTLDPQVEKVKMKIENILKSNQSSVVDLKARVEMDEKLAAERVKKTLEKAAEKVESDSKTVTEKAIIEKPPDKLANLETPPSLKSEPIKIDDSKSAETNPKLAEAKPKPAETKPAEEKKPVAPKETAKPAVNGNGNKNSSDKTMPPVEAVTPKEVPKVISETKPQPPPVVTTVKESVIKKEILTPDVKVVNEKTLAAADDGGEKVTESIVRGEPDLEVQSGNISPAVMSAAATNGKATTSRSLRNGASFGSSNGSSNGTTNGAASISNGTTNGTKLPHSDSKGDSIKVAAKTSLGSPVSDSITNGNDNHDKPTEKPPNVCSRLIGGCVQKIPCCAKLAARKKPEVEVINEKANKKKAVKETVKKTKTEKSGGALSKLNCCKKKDSADSEMVNMAKQEVKATKTEKVEEEAAPGCLSCCKRKNKIRDSSTDRRNATNEHWWQKMACCKSKQQKQQDWAARRDSILSQPTPPLGCFGKLKQKLSCKKGVTQTDESRRTSLISKKRSLSQAVPLEDSRSKLDTSLIEHNSHMRGAIPALPVPLAWFCFICNILVPGLGTILSGMFCLCFGRPRFGMYDGYRQRIGAFLIDLIVGIGQLFTVLFCLVGWGWSIWWGSMMIKVARKYKKLRLAALDPERAQPTTNNHRAART